MHADTHIDSFREKNCWCMQPAAGVWRCQVVETIKVKTKVMKTRAVETGVVEITVVNWNLLADPVFVTFCQFLPQFIFWWLSFDCENVDQSVLKWQHVKSLPHTWLCLCHCVSEYLTESLPSLVQQLATALLVLDSSSSSSAPWTLINDSPPLRQLQQN